jgi:hypothetical protein
MNPSEFEYSKLPQDKQAVLVPPDTAPTMRSPLLHHPTPTSESKYKYLFLGGCCLVALLLSIAVINAMLEIIWFEAKAI